MTFLPIQRIKANPRIITVPDDYPTIKEAIDAANPGDTIYVKTGTYKSVDVWKSGISLIGNESRIFGNRGVGIKVIADDVSISGFIIENCSDGIELFKCKNCNLTGNVIRNNNLGICLFLASFNRITENIIEKNNYTIHFVGSSNNRLEKNKLLDNKKGILLNPYSSQGVYIEDYSSHNIFSENVINGTEEYGIYFVYSPNNIVRKNNFTNNKHSSIKIESSDGILIESNSIKGYLSTRYGYVNGKILIYRSKNCNITKNSVVESYMDLSDSPANTLAKNNFTKTSIEIRSYMGSGGEHNVVKENNFFQSGIALRSEHNTVKENNFTESSPLRVWKEAIEIESPFNYIIRNKIERTKEGVKAISSGNKITENWFIKNEVGIWVFSSTNYIYHNDFIDNERQANARGRSTWDRNYWSDYNGSDSDNDGIGDEPYLINEKNADPHPLMRLFENYTQLPTLEIIERGIKVFVSPKEITTEPGPIVPFKINVTNFGSITEHMKIQVFRNGEEIWRKFFDLPAKSSKLFEVYVSSGKREGKVEVFIQAGAQILGEIHPSFPPFDSTKATITVKSPPPPEQNPEPRKTDESLLFWGIILFILVVGIVVAVIYSKPSEEEKKESNTSSKTLIFPLFFI